MANWELEDFDNGGLQEPYMVDVGEPIATQIFAVDGVDHRDRLASVSVVRRSKGHRYENYNAYSFDESVMDQMGQEGIEVIYVVDLDEGAVYEYQYDQFYGENARTWQHNRPQRGIPVRFARVWGGHADDFIRRSDGLSLGELREKY